MPPSTYLCLNGAQWRFFVFGFTGLESEARRADNAGTPLFNRNDYSNASESSFSGRTMFIEPVVMAESIRN